MSLSQNDFRKLLATPRAPPTDDGKPKAPKFAKPLPVKKEKEFARPVPRKFVKKDTEADDDGEEAARFRDRARERRQGINPDYKDSDQLLAHLSATQAPEAVIYEQSKYLGGDLSHTHLVKGLDFALLKKVRSELKDKNNDNEEDADEFLNRIEKEDVSQQTAAAGSTADSNAPTFNSPFAERIHTAAFANANLPLKNDLFYPGRMAFCWDLRGDDIPTTIIRSKADVKDEVKASTADSEIVIGKIVEILASVRFGTRTKEDGMTVGEKKALQAKNREEKLKKEAEELKKKREESGEDEMIVEDDGDDIFADVGRDYSLEVVDKTTGQIIKPIQQQGKANPLKSTAYFAKPVIDSDEEDGAQLDPMLTDILSSNAVNNQDDDDNDDMFADLDDSSKPKSTKPATATTTSSNNTLESLLSSSAAMLNTLQGAGTAEKILVSETSKLAKKPKGMSLSRLANNNYGEEDPEFDQYYDSDDDADEEEKAAADASQLDLGIKARKRTQMKRFDFETEEEFQRYKESQVVMPKSAYQFGVKSSDGRKNRKELQGGGKGGGSQEQKLDKELKQIDKIMGDKYGKSIVGGGSVIGRSGGGGNEKKREARGGQGGGPSKKR
ncbi:UNVERIFIED_CONTAM: hypothetical protein HDU68_012156 [Siphonaria sp. JEL0065]|nr:hypothetical protein HDU68_012156 [Siphonaria sp. JEL0065]